MGSLTTRQQEVLDFIRGETHRRGYSPTVAEIAERFSFASKNGVICHLKALEKKGAIERGKNAARAIRVLGGGIPYFSSAKQLADAINA